MCTIFGDDKLILTDIGHKVQNHINSDEESVGHKLLTVHEATILLNWLNCSFDLFIYSRALLTMLSSCIHYEPSGYMTIVYDDCIHTEGRSTFQNERLIFGTSHHLLAVAEENHECSSAG
jgi:hypothetical protein